MFSIRDLSRVLASTALSNGFLIILSLGLARALPNSEYASFAYSVAVFGIASLLLDFGLNIAAIRIHSLNKQQDIPGIFACIKFCVALLVAVVCIIGFAIIHVDSTVFYLQVGLLCAATNNVWLAMRVANQSAGDTRGFFNANIMLFVVRLVAISGVWWLSLPAFHYLLALYVYPYVVIFPFQRNLFAFKRHIVAFATLANASFNYAKWIFMSALLFVLSLQLPVLILNHQQKVQELAVLGVAMTVASFSSWLSYSLKPFFIGKYLEGKTEFAPYLKLLVQFCVLLVPASVAVYMLMNFGYADKFTNIGIVAVIVFAYTSLVFIFGLYNGQIHVSGRPELEAYVNLGRAVGVLFVMTVSNYSLVTNMAIVGAVMVGSELLLMAINYKLVHKTT